VVELISARDMAGGIKLKKTEQGGTESEKKEQSKTGG
jgi:hypothetical protein